jgi:2-oxoglutarate ferredoxin oxidoreductase subunit alpha
VESFVLSTFFIAPFRIRKIMSVSDVAVQENIEQPSGERVVNDIAIQVATVNGSGSQTANLVLLRSIFQMGVPVSGKNMFPSNIAGLPTWYTIRASERGYVGRKKEVDFLVAMNSETAREDTLTLSPGAAIVYDEPLKLNELRDDVIFYPVPFNQLIKPITNDAKLRRLIRNMIYDGILSRLLSIDMPQMERALRKQLGKKVKAIELNMQALTAGYDYAAEHLLKSDPFVIEPTDKTDGLILIEGNDAAAIGCMMAGVTFVGWYPITPSSSLCESLIEYLKKYRRDPDTGEATYAAIQAEDELAALGMVLGAGWMGARAMTSTAGPGLSLMAEFTGLGYYAEVPGVVFDIQRCGPSTGLPTRTGQQDILSAAFLSHGDTKHPMLLPGSVGECYSMALQAFDLAEVIQSPVFVMSDLDLGMNIWMSEPFDYPTTPIDRGKRLTADKLEQLGEFGRYRDVDGDGVPYRTVPGDGLPPYFARGSGHNEQAAYSEREDDYARNLARLDRKFETVRTLMPKPVVELTEAAGGVGLIAYGTTHWAIIESRDQLRAEEGLDTSYLRLRAFPFADEVWDFIDRCDRVYVVEQNRDAQMRSLLKLQATPERIAKLQSVTYFGGLPIDGRTVTIDVLAQERK